MTCGPRTHSSPAAVSPSAGTERSAPVSGSTIRASVFGTSGPIDDLSISGRPAGIRFTAGLVSVIPYPCTTSQPRRVATAAASAPSSGAAPEKITLTADRSYWSTTGCFASATAMGGATNTQVVRCSAMMRRNSGRSNLGMVTSPARCRSAKLSSTVMP